MRHAILALALAGGVIAAAPALAAQADQPAPPPHGHMHGMMGPDGILTRDQASAEADQMFDRMDTNHDGKLTPEERANFHAIMMSRHPGAAGMMGHGEEHGAGRSITRDEFRAHALAHFDRVDTNHDGKIDPTERANFREMQKERRAERAAPAAATTPAPQ